ncbi:hypothetical protein RHSIM_Rhsim05G0024500 [Rhododendron simsii]|uniref:Uncharacterized protein n=1 Tax=Rhododendron simsii TaxID=118357 RepID=A0A834LPY4_RHOSS|nr:hypothetical protein RHSIM_Rhsim05G0024500 [Rhododendron simsii]
MGVASSDVASGLGLSGLIPDTTIGKLEYLEYLDLSNNNITGLPSDFWSLGSLKSLNLSSNQLSQTLPSNIGNFGFLETLDFLQTIFLAESLMPLALFSAFKVRLSVFSGAVGGVIDLSQNQFQGHISQVNFSSSFNWSNLVYLDLSENQLSGELFSNLSEAQNLKHLNLAYNRFSAQPFPEISMLFGLEYLNLSGTKLMVPSHLKFQN